MSILRQIKKSFRLAKQRGWEKIYVVVDIHNTILKPCWYDEETFNYRPFAKKVLQMMSKRKDICLILWSSSHDKTLLDLYHKRFEIDGINFDYINENPECKSNDLACFEKKMYMDVGIDDKFGFNSMIDWIPLYLFFKLKSL